MTGSAGRAPRRGFVRAIGDLAVALGGACLPRPERDRFAARHGIDPAVMSFALGAVEVVSGTGLFMWGWIAFMRGAVDAPSMALLENWFPGLSNTHFIGLGLTTGIAWFVHPLSWVFLYLIVAGAGRIIAFVSAGDAFGEPAVWMVLRGSQLAARGVGGLRRRRALGPLRPDRIRHQPNGGLTIVTCRERPELDTSATIEVHGRYYRLIGVSDVSDGEHLALSYSFREAGQNEIFRGLVPFRRITGRDAGR